MGASTFVVVDGGYLLHKVTWHRNDSIRAIVAGYISYTFNHFGRNVLMVFDGYPEDGALRSTKTAERLHRSAALSCNNIMFEESTLIKVPQEKLIQRRLIDLLCSAFENQGIETKRASEDADSDIVRTALDKSTSFENVLIIGEDVDLLVLLNGLGSTIDVYFQKSGRGESGCVQFSTTSFNRGELEFSPGFELFLHAFSGCDTTSALFWQGKTKLWSVLQKNHHLVDLATVFLLPDASHEAIARAGEKCLVALYGGDDNHDSLHGLRYQLFVKTAANAKVNLARLPPTEEAARYHAYRTYHQVQKWLGVEKEASDWGWTRSQQGLTPITTKSEPAPQTLLKFLSCKCKKGCTGGCTCHKVGLKCSALCKFCTGKSLQHVPVIQICLLYTSRCV